MSIASFHHLSINLRVVNRSNNPKPSQAILTISQWIFKIIIQILYLTLCNPLKECQFMLKFIKKNNVYRLEKSTRNEDSVKTTGKIHHVWKNLERSLEVLVANLCEWEQEEWVGSAFNFGSCDPDHVTRVRFNFWVNLCFLSHQICCIIFFSQAHRQYVPCKYLFVTRQVTVQNKTLSSFQFLNWTVSLNVRPEYCRRGQMQINAHRENTYYIRSGYKQLQTHILVLFLISITIFHRLHDTK